MSESNPYRVFVSHAFEETFDYLRVFEFLESDDRFYYLNRSRPENMPEAGGLDAMKDELIEQIKAAEVIVVLPALAEAQADLVRFQMDVADANKIGIVAMKHIGGLGDIPTDVAERAKEIVEWNEREMVDAIKRAGRGEDTQRWEVIDFPGIEDLMKDEENDEKQ
ncbi:MAG: hypothetical protein AAF660_04175 [Pseudomonadota bacterium]